VWVLGLVGGCFVFGVCELDVDWGVLGVHEFDDVVLGFGLFFVLDFCVLWGDVVFGYYC